MTTPCWRVRYVTDTAGPRGVLLAFAHPWASASSYLSLLAVSRRFSQQLHATCRS